MDPNPNQVKIEDNLITASPQAAYLAISLEGPFRVGLVSKVAGQILEFCRLHQPEKVLFDVRDLTGNPSKFERFTMASVFTAQFLIAWGLGRIPHIRFAVVGRPPLVDSSKFEEDVAFNRGLAVKVFLDQDEAVHWLERKES